jgi:hypothetical protein
MKQLSKIFSMSCIALLLTSSVQAGAGNSLAIGTAEANDGQVASVDLMMSSTGAVQGLVMVFEWDERKAEGVSVTASGPIANAELIVSRVEPSFMILSAVIDADGEGPDSIPAAADQTIGSASLRCICPGFRQEIALALVDSRYARVDGGPLLDNLLVIDGDSIKQAEGLGLDNGELVCNPDADGPTFLCGGPLDDDGNIPTAEGRPGETVTLCYYYRDPAPGGGRIQGFSMAVSYDCNLSCVEDSVSITGGAIDTANAEFFNLHCDNDAGDGDGCEMVVGMLIDLNAAHDGRRLPVAEDFSLLFCVDYTISEDAEDGSCLDVTFENGVDGRGQVDTENLVSIDFFEVPAQTANCQICVEADLPFIRGDCNFNQSVNIADAAAMIGFMFLAEFPAPCFDSCDADDNGLHNVSDPVYLLNYLFVPGNLEPPAPFPTPGEDPTDDALDCSGEATFP